MEQLRSSFFLEWKGFFFLVTSSIEFFKVENNSSEPTRIFKESFRDQRWAWEESVRAEKRDRDAEREKETFRRQRHHQSDDGVDAETSLSLSLHLYLIHRVAFFVKKFFENADFSPFGFFRAVGKNREWGYRKGREREELGKVPRSTKKKKQPDGKQRAKVEREATGLKRKEKMTKWGKGWEKEKAEIQSYRR